MKREANKKRGGTVKQPTEKRATNKGKNIAADIQTPGESFTPDEIQTPDEAIARVAKARGLTVNEIKLKWDKELAQAEVERLRTTVQEAEADKQAMRQEVVTAQMWRRWEKRKREQERQKHDHELAELARAKITANETNETTIGNKPRLRKPKPRKQMEHLTAQGLIRGAGGKGRNILLRIEPDQLSFSIAGRKGVYTFRPSGRKLLDALLTAYSKQDGGGWVELPKERNGLRKKIGNLFPPATASLIQRETRTPCGGGYTGRVRLWVVEQ